PAELWLARSVLREGYRRHPHAAPEAGLPTRLSDRAPHRSPLAAATRPRQRARRPALAAGAEPAKLWHAAPVRTQYRAAGARCREPHRRRRAGRIFPDPPALSAKPGRPWPPLRDGPGWQPGRCRRGIASLVLAV